MTDEQYQRLQIVLTQSKELQTEIAQVTTDIEMLNAYINNGAKITKITFDVGDSSLQEIIVPVDSVDGILVLNMLLETKQNLLKELQHRYDNLEVDPNVCSCGCSDNCSCKQGGNINE